MHNFDVNEVTSDSVLRDVKKAGFRIRYFSAGFKSYMQLPAFKKEPVLKRIVIKFLAYVPVFPLNHLGGVTTILGEKL